MTDASTDEHTLLGLLADIRAAAGDREGRLMQAELVEHIRGLKAQADSQAARIAELEAERERIARLCDDRAGMIDGLREYLRDFEGDRARLRAEVEANAGEVERLREILERIESACNDRAALTTSEAYLLAEAVPGMNEALTKLDDARRDARSMLAKPSTPWVNPLAAEVEKLRADLEWVSLEWGGSRGDYAAWVLRRGGTGDLSDIRSFIAARKGEGVAGV